MSYDKFQPELLLSSTSDWKSTKIVQLRASLEGQAFSGDKVARGNLKSLYQRQAGLLVSEKKAMIFEWATGVGKTGCGVQSMCLLPGRWLIVHYREYHKQTWMDNDPGCGKIEYCGYKSLHKKKGEVYTGIILDEAHHVTESSIRELQDIQTEYVVALSALIPSPKKALLTKWMVFHTDKIPMVSAIKKGLLPIPKIIACPVALKTERNRTYDVNRKGPKAQWETVTIDEYLNNPHLHSRFRNYHVLCSEQDYYDLLNGDILYWKNIYFEEKEEWQYIKWQRLAGDRKKFLATVKSKTFIALHNYIVTLNRRFLTFAVDFIEIAKVSNTNTVSHKNKDNKSIIDAFNKGTIDTLYSVDILNESANLERIEVVLLASLNTQQVANVQRFGRSMRGEFPILVVPFVKGTSDEKNFMKFVSGLESFVIMATTLNQVKAQL